MSSDSARTTPFQLAVVMPLRTRGGAGWDEIAAALALSPGEAWDAYTRAIDEQAGESDLDAEAAEAARELAGARP